LSILEFSIFKVWLSSFGFLIILTLLKEEELEFKNFGKSSKETLVDPNKLILSIYCCVSYSKVKTNFFIKSLMPAIS